MNDQETEQGYEEGVPEATLHDIARDATRSPQERLLGLTRGITSNPAFRSLQRFI